LCWQRETHHPHARTTPTFRPECEERCQHPPRSFECEPRCRPQVFRRPRLQRCLQQPWEKERWCGPEQNTDASKRAQKSRPMPGKYWKPSRRYCTNTANETTRQKERTQTEIGLGPIKDDARCRRVRNRGARRPLPPRESSTSARWGNSCLSLDRGRGHPQRSLRPRTPHRRHLPRSWDE
jgi:hypothetical protein